MKIKANLLMERLVALHYYLKTQINHKSPAFPVPCPFRSHVICNILLNSAATEKEIKIYDVPEWPTQV